MATVTSHLLDAVHGRSAAGATVTLTQISVDGTRQQIFEVQTDVEGRISQTINVPAGDTSKYELEFHTADYFRQFDKTGEIGKIMQAVVVRIAMPEPNQRYHIPVIASPHSYSLWWSA